MAIHHRITVPEPASGRPVNRPRDALRVTCCAALLCLLAACVTQSPTVPVPVPETPVPETPPENEDGWNAVTG